LVGVADLKVGTTFRLDNRVPSAMPEIRVQLNEGDYIEAAQAAAKPTKRIWIFFGVVSLLLIAGAAMAWDSRWQFHAILVLSVWFGMFFGARIGQILYIPVQARRVFKQQRMGLPYTLRWTDESVTLTTDESVSAMLWKQFFRAVELDQQFVLFFSAVMFLMIPKRSFPDETVMDNFRTQVASSVAKEPRSG
jgi:hypothetical protein